MKSSYNNKWITYLSNEKIDDTELNIIKQLKSKCDEYDKHTSSSNPSINGKVLMHLLYNDDILLSFIYFTPGFNENEVNCKLVIDPDHRNICLYKQVYDELLNYAKENTVKKYNFIVDSRMTYIIDFLEYQNAKHVHSTYEMRLSQTKKTESHGVLKITQAKLEDLNEMTKIGCEAFSTNEVDEYNYNKSNIDADDTYCFTAKVDKDIVGVITAMNKGDFVSLADLAVQWKYRGNGFGSSILKNVVNYMISKKAYYFCLSVETKNVNALKVYERAGFQKFNIYNVYEITINQQ